jgi:hypothetical protein
MTIYEEFYSNDTRFFKEKYKDNLTILQLYKFLRNWFYFLHLLRETSGNLLTFIGENICDYSRAKNI